MHNESEGVGSPPRKPFDGRGTDKINSNMINTLPTIRSTSYV